MDRGLAHRDAESALCDDDRAHLAAQSSLSRLLQERSLMLLYPIGTSGEVIHFEPAVLALFARHSQLRFWHREAGGQLFARIGGQRIVVSDATAPRPNDRRGRFFFAPDRAREQAEIETMFARDLHYIGDWHTHPERRPTPSSRDHTTMSSRVRLSRHRLAGFVFVIVGQLPPPCGLTVIVHDGASGHVLPPHYGNLPTNPA